MPLDLHLVDHPFVSALIQDNKHFLAELVESRGQVAAGAVPKPVSLAPHEFYASEVLEAFEPLSTTLDRVKWSLSFLRGFPNARSYQRQGITRDKWMEYHYAYFVVSYSSFRDLSLLLINEVYRLGIPPRLCTRDAVLTNDWVKHTSVPTMFKTIENLVGKHQEARNLHVHRGRTPDIAAVLQNDDFRQLTLISLVSQGDPLFAEANRDLLMEGLRWTADDLRGRITGEIANMVTALKELLAVLKAEYQRKYRELGGGTGGNSA